MLTQEPHGSAALINPHECEVDQRVLRDQQFRGHGLGPQLPGGIGVTKCAQVSQQMFSRTEYAGACLRISTSSSSRRLFRRG